MSIRDPSQAMGTARSDPGGGEIPMMLTKQFAVCPESEADSPVRGVVDKYDKAKRLIKNIADRFFYLKDGRLYLF